MSAFFCEQLYKLWRSRKWKQGLVQNIQSSEGADTEAVPGIYIPAFATVGLALASWVQPTRRKESWNRIGRSLWNALHKGVKINSNSQRRQCTLKGRLDLRWRSRGPGDGTHPPLPRLTALTMMALSHHLRVLPRVRGARNDKSKEFIIISVLHFILFLPWNSLLLCLLQWVNVFSSTLRGSVIQFKTFGNCKQNWTYLQFSYCVFSGYLNYTFPHGEEGYGKVIKILILKNLY